MIRRVREAFWRMNRRSAEDKYQEEHEGAGEWPLPPDGAEQEVADTPGLRA